MKFSDTQASRKGLHAGWRAFQQISSFKRAISDNFQIPRHIGRHISGLDSAQFVKASAANHMRPDDYVVGLTYQGVSRAYPLWICDHYHIIHDRIQDRPLVFVTCERCQSGAAFEARLGDQDLKFAARGIFNATLLMSDRPPARGTDKPSLWLHSEGVAIEGARSGTFLNWIATFHMSWQEWLNLHPDTNVMVPPEDPFHRDARLGHGREEYFSRPGMEPIFVETISGSLDDRYPENEMVLGLNLDAGVAAFPLREVQSAGQVLETELGGNPIVVLAGPQPETATMAAYSRELEGRLISLRQRDGKIFDLETGSEWTIEGKAVGGPWAGKQLMALRWNYIRWHAWVYSHPATTLYRTPRFDLPYPDSPEGVQLDRFEPILRRIIEIPREVIVEGTQVNLELPHQTTAALRLRVDGSRLNLYEFETLEAAREYCWLQGAWSCLPLSPRLARRRSQRWKNFVLESDPDRQHADLAKGVRLPDEQIQWSDLITDSSIVDRWRVPERIDSGQLDPNFGDLVAALKTAGFDVVNVAFLPRSQLRPGVVSAVSATINADRLTIAKAKNSELVSQLAGQLEHALAVGVFLFQSIPVAMYEDPFYEIGQLPEHQIRWSSLLESRRFNDAVLRYLNETSKNPSIPAIDS